MATITKRTSSTGKVFFQAQIRLAGSKPISKSFKTEKEANKYAITHEAKLINNELVNQVAMKDTIKCVIDQFLKADPNPNKPITAKSKTRLKYLQHENELGCFSIKTLTPSRLTLWIKERMKINKPPTVYWYYCNLKQAMLWHSIENNYNQHLFDTVKCASTVVPRRRRITDDEIKKLHKAMDEHMTGKTDEMKWAIDFAINTAMRAGEMLAFRWKDVELEKRHVRLDGKITKTGTTREVALTTNAVNVLKAIKERHYEEDNEARVFGFYTEPRHLCRQFKIISLWAGIPELLWHHTRHEATSRLYEITNLTDVQIASITGHKNINVLAKYYAHIRTESIISKLP